MPISCVYPQLIIISSLKYCLISYTQVQGAQVLPIDPLTTPITMRPLSGRTELEDDTAQNQ